MHRARTLRLLVTSIFRGPRQLGLRSRNIVISDYWISNSTPKDLVALKHKNVRIMEILPDLTDSVPNIRVLSKYRSSQFDFPLFPSESKIQNKMSR